ncbi:hypothetical protein [Aeromonas hydrophila]|uniref:hypothetical protein n=1 Tax=Aeromonas hydrophila TaxID=644 RepID=UPI00235E1728|nr:hypothetical protein [Aeromonas hydrophila]
MNRESLFKMYEKSYYHEMETREKIAGRVQINFALAAAGFTVISYMIRMLDFDKNLFLIILCCISIFACLILSFFCIKSLINAFWGNEYKGIPTANEIDRYRNELIAHNAKIDIYNHNYPGNIQPSTNVEQKTYDFIYEKFRDCSSHNSEINESRYLSIHDSFRWLLYSGIPFLISISIFIMGDLDVSSPRKETLISDKSIDSRLKELNVIISDIKETIAFKKESGYFHSKKQIAMNINYCYPYNLIFKDIHMPEDEKLPPPPPTEPIPPATRSLKDEAPKPTPNNGQEHLHG